MVDFYKRWRSFLAEAQKDAKVLRNINVDYIKKEVPPGPDESPRDYFLRVQQLERDPKYPNPIFPQELVDWIESLSDEYFPSGGRKRFAKWLGNSIYYEETDGPEAPSPATAFKGLTVYDNDVRYIVDYLNASNDLPKDLWSLNFRQVHSLATDWHTRLAAGMIGKDELPSGKLNYVGKKVVYKYTDRAEERRGSGSTAATQAAVLGTEARQ